MPLLNINSQDLPKISLTLSMWKKAKDFADRQINYQKAEQVYLNTLAVLSVNQYLERAGIKTDLSSSNGYNLTMQTMLDNAELTLPEYGVIDCRPLHHSDQFLSIPEEAQTANYITHLAVAISPDFGSATLLGFTPQVAMAQIPLTELKPIAKFLKFLESYKSAITEPSQVSNSFKEPLTSWFTATSNGGWLNLTNQIIQELNLNLLGTSKRSLVFRNSVANSTMTTSAESKQNLLEGISKIKLWELSQQDQHHKIAIIVNVLPTINDEVDISIQIFPIENHLYLPVGITIQILDEHNKTILQVETTYENDKIEFCLSGEPQEIFTVQVICADQVQTERFVI